MAITLSPIGYKFSMIGDICNYYRSVINLLLYMINLLLWWRVYLSGYNRDIIIFLSDTF